MTCHFNNLCLDLQRLEPYFVSDPGIQTVELKGPWNDSLQHQQVYFKPSKTLLRDPPYIKDLYLKSDYADCTWSQISNLLQHFRIEDSSFPLPATNQEVSDDLKEAVGKPYKKSNYTVQGLRLTLPSYEEYYGIEGKRLSDDHERFTTKHPEQDFEKDKGILVSKDKPTEQLPPFAHTMIENKTDTPNMKPLVPFPGMENATSLVLEGFMDCFQESIPSILQLYIWPELRYLQLRVKHINKTYIHALNKTVPKLTYLKLFVPVDKIPDVVWTFDWDSLPWRTGFVASSGVTKCEKLTLHLKGKITSNKISPINIFIRGIERDRFDMDVDLSNNGLDSLGYIFFNLQLAAVYHPNFNTYANFNLSHNYLKSVSLVSRVEVAFMKDFGTNLVENVAIVGVLDLSFNQLQFNGSDFLLMKDLREIYLSHNQYTELPKYTVGEGDNMLTYTIRNLHQLVILDLSYNLIEVYFNGGVNPMAGLAYDDFSPIRELYLSNNNIHHVPTFVYTSMYLTYVDLSQNGMVNWPMEYTDAMKSIGTRSVRTTLNLTSNRIHNLWTDVFYEKILLSEILEVYDVNLDGNPINCGCETHRIYEYMVSSSQSERPDLDKDDLPDFSFYETRWKCASPLQWAGIPLMQISEYEYDYSCDENLGNCPIGCFCYHSWNLDGVLIANCSHGNKYVLSTFPASLPNNTSNLILSHNNITTLCKSHPYFSELEYLALSWNRIESICPNFWRELVNLKYLNLEGNMIKEILDDLEQLQCLSSLILSANSLEELPHSIQNMTRLEHIELSGNTFRCDCDTFWMTGWLIKSLSISQDTDNLVCFSGKGRGKRLINLHQDDVGCLSAHQLPASPLLKHALIGVASAFVLTIVFVIVIYRYRGHIKILIYTRFGFHPWDRVKENPQEKDYDAFVSFCRKDSDWVLKTLLPYLEAPQCGFHLCIHDRDFVPGATITKNIMTAIEYSRRTILVLTPDFIKSGWCDLEFQASHKRALDDRSNFLIVVVLKEVDNKDLDETLQLYMKTNTYVSVSDKWFWQKMLYAMPKVPIDKLKEEQNNSEIISKNKATVMTTPGGIADKIYEGDDIPLLNHEDVNAAEEDLRTDTDQEDQCTLNVEDNFTDSDDEFHNDKVFQRPMPARNCNAIAKLPPLFKRINTYNNAMRNDADQV